MEISQIQGDFEVFSPFDAARYNNARNTRALLAARCNMQPFIAISVNHEPS
jgi:hypothetical protein